MSDNTVTITGNLPEDPTLRFTQNGVPVASFVVMQTKREKQGDQYVDGAKNGLRVTVWRDQAENVSESIRKGDRVTATGQLEPQQWQDRETGANRYGWELNASEVAVSLRWATAVPQKVDRRQGGQRPQQGGDPWETTHGGHGPNATQGGYDDPPF